MVSKATTDNRKKKKVAVRVKGGKSRNKRFYYIDIEGVGHRVCYIDIVGIGIKSHDKKELDELVATLDPGGLGIRSKKKKEKGERIRKAKAKYAREKARRARRCRK